jgi:hypothetical protein
MLPRVLRLMLLFGFSLSTPEAWARLPKPIKMTGVVVAADVETKTLFFKAAKGKKPFLLEWDEETEFSRNRQAVSAAEMKAGTVVVISYREVSFHHPRLKKVVVDGK